MWMEYFFDEVDVPAIRNLEGKVWKWEKLKPASKGKKLALSPCDLGMVTLEQDEKRHCFTVLLFYKRQICTTNSDSTEDDKRGWRELAFALLWFISAVCVCVCVLSELF